MRHISVRIRQNYKYIPSREGLKPLTPLQASCSRIIREVSSSNCLEPNHPSHQLLLAIMLSTYTFHVSSSESASAAKLPRITSCFSKLEFSRESRCLFVPNNAEGAHDLFTAICCHCKMASDRNFQVSASTSRRASGFSVTM